MNYELTVGEDLKTIHVSIKWVRANTSDRTFSETIAEMKAWCEGNLAPFEWHFVRGVFTHNFGFSSAANAMLFKLRFHAS